MAGVFPHIDFKREITVGHLLLDVDTPTGQPTPRSTRRSARARTSSTCGARCSTARSTGSSAITRAAREEVKGAGRGGQGDIWLAKSGFGGTEYLLSGVFSEGSKRGLAPTPAWPSCWRSTRRGATACCTRATSPSASTPTSRCSTPSGASPCAPPTRRPAQGYTPFEGQELTGQVTATFLRGELAWEHGRVVGRRARPLHRAARRDHARHRPRLPGRRAPPPALIEWADGRARVLDVRVLPTDGRRARRRDRSAPTSPGIDVPFGWPDAFVRRGRRASARASAWPDVAPVPTCCYRETDRHVETALRARAIKLRR